VRFAINFRQKIAQNPPPNEFQWFRTLDAFAGRFRINGDGPGATIDSWALRTIVDPTADGCPRSPYVYHVPWVLYLHLVLLSKNIFPVSEFAVNPSRLPHRTVADRRRTAQRVQERFQTVHRGAQERPLSAAIIGSDHVNFGHGEYTVSGCDSLLFNYLVDGPCLHCVPKFFFLRAFCNGVFTTAAYGFPCSFSKLSVVILQGLTVFRGPPWHLSLLPRRRRNQLST